MTEQSEALLQRLERLGQDSVGNYGMPICAEAAAELRRLYSANEGQTRLNVSLVIENRQLLREKLELLEALKRIDEMCASPPNFSDATMQEIARAAIAMAELGGK